LVSLFQLLFFSLSSRLTSASLSLLMASSCRPGSKYTGPRLPIWLAPAIIISQ